jgi:lipoyl(octanoyl) transferase
MGIQVVFADRGGDVTYHGPGQLVAYPVFDLRRRRRDLHRFVSDLEETIIRTVSDFGILATRDPDHRGVWVGDEQIGAVGLRVKHWVSTHGVSLNVDLDLAPFSLINPCGLPRGRATSISALSSGHVSVNTAKESFLTHFAEVFDVTLEWEADTRPWSDTDDREIASLVCAASS